MPNGSGPPDYRQLRLSVRPTRSAIAIPDIEEWTDSARRVVEYFSQTWGGCGNLLFACREDGFVSETTWRLLQMFDPDRFGFYAATHQGRRRANPEAFEKWLVAQAKRLAKQSGGTPEEWQKRIRENHVLMTQPLSSWRPPDETEQAALARCSPLHWRRHVFQDVVTADATPTRQLVDMALLEPIKTESPVVLPDVDSLPPELALVFEARFGQIAPSYEAVLREMGIEVVRTGPWPAWLSTAIQHAWTGETHRMSFSWLEDDNETEPRWMLQQYADSTAFGRTLVGCNWFRPWLVEWDDRPFVFVVGNSAEDFSWALALDRLLGAGAWVPERLLRPRNANMAKTLFRAMVAVANSLSGYGRGERRIIVTSASMKRDALSKVIAAASKLSYNSVAFDHASPEEMLADVSKLQAVQRILDADRNEDSQFEPFVAGRQASLVNTPLPSVLPSNQPGRLVAGPTSRMTWFVDVDVEGHRVPARSVLSDLVAEPHTTDRDIRAGRDGVSYFSESGFVAYGQPIEKTLARPRLLLPDALAIFRRLLPDGWTCNPSQAGRFSRATLEALGGVEGASATFLSPPKLALLRAFLATSRSGVDPGVFLDTVERRYLCFDDAATVTGLNATEVRALLDELLLAGVLERGLVLDCGTCSYDGWYPVAELGTDFRCPRCRSRTPITATGWKLPPTEPLWFYSLSEVLRQALELNAHAPLLALAKLKERASAFLFEPEMEIGDDSGWHCELDIWVVREGRIAIGEAKTTDRLGTPSETKRLVANLRKVADAIGAHDVIVATTSLSWRSTVESSVRAAFASSTAQPQFLTGLLSQRQ